MIGGLCLPVHGYARATLDVDVFIRPERENAARIHRALREFGHDITDLSVDDLLSYKVLLRQYAVEADFHPFVAGVTFDEVWANKVKDRIGEVEVYFAGFDDLIAMKRAAGRPKDLEDIRQLMLVREQIGQ